MCKEKNRIKLKKKKTNKKTCNPVKTCKVLLRFEGEKSGKWEQTTFAIHKLALSYNY